MTIFLAVQIGHGVHGETGSGQFHDAPGKAVVVDMGVRDDHSGDVLQGVTRPLQARFHDGQSAVGEPRLPYPAIDDSDLVAVRQDVHVDTADGVDADRQLHPGDPRDRHAANRGNRGNHPCMRSSSVNHTLSSTW